MSRLEHLVAAIGYYNNLHDPDSVAYRLKNPLLVKSFGRPGKHEIDEEGRRVFDSIVAGYRACLFDTEIKISGNSRAGLKSGWPTSFWTGPVSTRLINSSTVTRASFGSGVWLLPQATATNAARTAQRSTSEA